MPSNLIWRYQPRQRLELGYRPRRELYAYQADRLRDFEFDKLTRPENLERVFNHLKSTGGQAPGSDGVRFDAIGNVDFKPFMKSLSQSLSDGSYRPKQLRSVSLPKPNGGERVLSIQTITDRTVAKAMQLCLDGYWRQRLPFHATSVNALFKRLAKCIREYNHTALVIDDIRNCYPSVRCTDVLAVQFEHIENRQLRDLLRKVIFGHDGLLNETAGVGQGSPYSPVAVEAFLYHRLDQIMERRFGRKVYRYVDNIIVPVSKLECTDLVKNQLRSELCKYQLELKGEDKCIDLRDPNHGVSLLGLIPTWQNNAFDFNVSESTFSSLNVKLSEAVTRELPLRAIRHVISSWISTYKIGIKTKALKRDASDQIRSMASSQGINLDFHWILGGFDG